MREAVWRAPVAWPSNVRAERERLDQIQQNAGGDSIIDVYHYQHDIPAVSTGRWIAGVSTRPKLVVVS